MSSINKIQIGSTTYNICEAELGEKYVKPSDGIPKTDFTSIVQTSLEKADSALQSADIDNTLSVAGKSADAKAVGDNLASKEAAGTARAIISELTSKLYNAQKITMTNGGYIITNTNNIDITNVQTDSAWSYAVVECIAGDLFTINAQGGDAPRTFAFIDSNGALIRAQEKNIQNINLCIKAPYGTAYLIINDSSNSDSYYGDISASYNDVQISINQAAKGNKVIYTGLEYGYFNTIKYVSARKARCKFFRVEKGKTYTVVFSGGNSRKISFFENEYKDNSVPHNYIEYASTVNNITVLNVSDYPFMGVYYSDTNDYGSAANVYIIEHGEDDGIKKVFQRNYSIHYANADDYLNFMSPLADSDFSSERFNNYDKDDLRKMNVHPKVLFFENGLFKHQFWMAYTPYPLKSEYRENPCVAYSEDGYYWTNIGSPIDASHDDSSNYNSDTHLVYNTNTNKLEVWYRFVDSVNHQEIIYRKTSSNGTSWSSREELNVSSSPAVKTLSPSVIWDSSNQKYLIWVVNNNTNKIDYYESTTGNNWSSVRSIDLTYQYNSESYNVWHIDVEKIDGKYVLLAMARKDGVTGFDNCKLFISTSEDNETFTTPEAVITGRAGSWDSSIYRSCIVKVIDEYRIYYSALKEQSGEGIYRMGITTSNQLSLFMGVVNYGR